MNRIPPSLVLLLLILSPFSAMAQDTVTGAFEGTVTNSLTGDPIASAQVEITNVETGIKTLKTTDARGRFYQGLLLPGVYKIKISLQGFQPREVEQRLNIARTGEVVPIPVTLDPLAAVSAPLPLVTVANTKVRAEINTRDASRGDFFSELMVTLLPLGATTLTGSFDELAMLLPGVAPPPQTLGGGVGPGQGAGVGTAGQFSVNGLRSRANNFTVDGSDNNDEDIGVRRQGFVALIPQSAESIREYQAITLLAPAQFGRNLGAQVNAVSKSGGAEVHGTAYGFINSSRLNARNFFDTTKGQAETPLRAASGQPVLYDDQPIIVHDQSGGKDSFTFGRIGATLGGPVKHGRTFYFFSGEGQVINAVSEEHFATPTVEQRGAFGSGATGVFKNPFARPSENVRTAAIPMVEDGAAIFSLFPFPNQPSGIYGPNTFTQVLPASGRGVIASGKFDHHLKINGNEQAVTGRYNITDDRRVLPTTGEAIFSAIEPRVRTQNVSFFLNSQVKAAVFNQARLSYGRTRLAFREVRDREFLIPSSQFPSVPFLLNAPLRLNRTLPSAPGVPNRGPVVYRRVPETASSDEQLGAIGQVIVAGFSPLGVDVYNFPQQRVNNTYQAADTLTWRMGDHSLSLGADSRRSELNSDLPRNSRPLVTFNGGPRLICQEDICRLPSSNDPNPFIRPEDLAAFGAASNFLLTLNTSGSSADIALRFYQIDFYGQDEWRLRRNLSLSYGLRYEYNTPPRELNRRIEKTFADPALRLTPGLNDFLEGRAQIFEADRNNFAPRAGLAYAPSIWGADRLTVIRAGYGVFYDQALGAVVSQSRNVFPTFLPLNFGVGAFSSVGGLPLRFINPTRTFLFTDDGQLAPVVKPDTLTALNPNLPLSQLLNVIRNNFPNALGATLPTRHLATPLAHQYSLAVEQQFGAGLSVSLAYVGTLGRRLLRFTTPNLGPGVNLALTDFGVTEDETPRPLIFGMTNNRARQDPTIGAINRFEATAESRYDSLQLQARGRSAAWQYLVSYTFSKAIDDVSDVFDLAGAPALPQNSVTFAGERGPANFDRTHRLAASVVYDFSARNFRRALPRLLLGDLQFISLGQFQTGQPFTVGSIFDVNLDGNLTDRLNTTNGLLVTGDRLRPLRLVTTDTFALLAPFGQDGAVARNSFRAGNLLELNLAISRTLTFVAQRKLALRAEIFNLPNRANFGVPIRLLEAPGFGQASRAVTPARRIQFSLKYLF